MLYRVKFTASDSCKPLIWRYQTRKTAARIIKDILPQPGEIVISVCDAPRHFVAYNPIGDGWDVCMHAYGLSLYYGSSYKTLSGALNKLDRLAETEVRI